MTIDRDPLRRAYDGGAADRAARALPDWRVNARETYARQLVSQGVTALVEFGCGPGLDAAAFMAHGLDVLAIDLSPAHVEQARRLGVNAAVGDLVHTDLPDHSADAAWSASTLLHIGDDELPMAAAEIARIVRPGGPVLLGVWGGVDRLHRHDEDALDPPRQFVFRSDHTLRALLGGSLTIARIERGVPDPTLPDLHYQWIHARSGI